MKVRHCKYCKEFRPSSEFRPKRARCNTCETMRDRLRRNKHALLPIKYEPYVVKTMHSPIPILTAIELRNCRIKYKPNTNDLNSRPRNIIQHSCKECGTIHYNIESRIFCSSECSNRYHRRIRHKAERARLRKVKIDNIDPLLVFHKHDWHCAHCGVYTPYELMGKYKPNSPELDHIIPLSKGGEHSYSNVQLLCRLCNNTKSNNV